MKAGSKLLAIVLSLAMVSTLMAGCGGKSGGDSSKAANTGTTDAQSSKAADGKEPITLRFSWWGSQARNDQTLKVVDMFQKENPWITVDSEYVGWDVYWENLSTQIASGEMPDVLQHDYRYLETYVGKNLLMPIDGFIGKELDLSNVGDATLTGGKVNGKLYGVPMGMNCFSVIYDVNRFKEAGVAEPDFGWTYDDFLNTCRTFKDKLGIYGCDLTNFEDHVLYFLRSKGVTLYSQTGKGLGYDDDSILEECFQRRLDMVREKLLPAPDVAKQASGTEDSLIIRGKAAMVTYWSNAAAAVANATDDVIKVAPVYGPDADKGLYIKPSMFASISANTKYAAESAMLIDYITNNVDANKVMMGERGVPISSKIREALTPDLDETGKAIFDLLDYAQEHSSPINKPDPEGAGQVVELLQNLEEKVLYEQITPAEAAATFRKEATSILESK